MMTMRTISALGAVALTLFFLGGVPGPVSAQMVCQQTQITTTRTSTPIAVTPLDAIAFPVPLAPASTQVVRQIVVCPPGATPLPFFTPAPTVIGAPIFSTPVFGAPFFDTPIVAPAYAVPTVVPAAPLYGTPRPTAPPGPPVIVGAVPHDSVRDLATQGAGFDRMVVTVAGTAAAVADVTDVSGAPLTTFRLDAQGASVGVIVWGHARVRAGDSVRVSGPFYVSTPFVGPSGTPWHGVIEAQILER